jgi:hypothetical protein
VTVWKYQLKITDVQTIWLPVGATILSVGMQYGSPTMWALVDPTRANSKREIRIAGTGHVVPQSDASRFIGTLITEGGALVWHVFEYL